MAVRKASQLAQQILEWIRQRNRQKAQTATEQGDSRPTNKVLRQQVEKDCCDHRTCQTVTDLPVAREDHDDVESNEEVEDQLHGQTQCSTARDRGGANHFAPKL